MRVGAGVVLDRLNEFLRPHGLCFGPDVATSSRATLGGMIAMKIMTQHPERVSSAVLGGMGWLKDNSPFQQFWETIKQFGPPNFPAACLGGISKLGVTEAEVKAVRVPVTIIVGDRDPCRWMYVEPLRRVRPDWPLHIINNANHVSCLGKPEFRAAIEAALAQSSAKPAH